MRGAYSGTVGVAEAGPTWRGVRRGSQWRACRAARVPPSESGLVGPHEAVLRVRSPMLQRTGQSARERFAGASGVGRGVGKADRAGSRAPARHPRRAAARGAGRSSHQPKLRLFHSSFYLPHPLATHYSPTNPPQPAMATIHSLPTELIRHTLALAYPPGEDGSAGGLCRTALVHSSWRQPSQSVMTEKVTFFKEDKTSIAAFIEKGPVGFRSLSVEFTGCAEHDIRAVLGKAQPGGITKLDLSVSTRHVTNGLFKFASLDRELKSRRGMKPPRSSLTRADPSTQG